MCLPGVPGRFLFRLDGFELGFGFGLGLGSWMKEALMEGGRVSSDILFIVWCWINWIKVEAYQKLKLMKFGKDKNKEFAENG